MTYCGTEFDSHPDGPATISVLLCGFHKLYGE